MPKFRKRPVVIEAVQFNGENGEVIAEWSGGAVRSQMVYNGRNEPMDQSLVPGVVVNTLEGKMAGFIGYWVIRGVNGEFYPCEPDIFEKTYETVDPVVEVPGQGPWNQTKKLDWNLVETRYAIAITDKVSGEDDPMLVAAKDLIGQGIIKMLMDDGRIRFICKASDPEQSIPWAPGTTLCGVVITAPPEVSA